MPVARSSRLTVEDNLGDIIRRMHCVPNEAVALAAERQRTTGEKIGEAMVAQGAITQDQLVEALRTQADLRSGKPHVALAALDRMATSSATAVRTAQGKVCSPETNPRGVRFDPASLGEV